MTAWVRGIQAYSGQSYASLERIAAHVRSRLLPGHPLDSAIPGLELFERLDEYRVLAGRKHLSLQYAVEDLAPGLEAQSYYSVDEDAIVVALTPATYEDLRSGVCRALFTFCHEIGHAVLHSAELLARGIAVVHGEALARAMTGTHKPFRDTEWQANGFAAAMLMPAAGLAAMDQHYGIVSPQHVASSFSVSLQAAELRTAVFLARRRELLR